MVEQRVASGDQEDVRPFRRTFDYTAAGTVRSLEDSHQRLGLNRFDIVYIHDCAEDWHGAAFKDRFAEAMAGAAKVLAAMRDRGEIRGWGMGLNLVEPALACLETERPDVFLIAGRYTLLDQSALAEFLPYCVEQGIAVVAGGPYNSGILAVGPREGATYNYRPADAAMMDRARRIAAVCDRHRVDLRAAALQFVLAHPAIVSVIPGARSIAEVEENVALLERPIPPGLWADLKEAGLLDPAAPTPRS